MTSMPSDREIARAQALGRLAGGAQAPIESCPYPAAQMVLRGRWILAYVSAGGRAGVDGQAPLRELRGRIRTWWRGGGS